MFSGRCPARPVIEFPPDGKYIAIDQWEYGVYSQQYGSFELRNTTMGQCLGLFRKHLTKITSVAFSPAYDLVASASRDGDIQLFYIQSEPRHRPGDESIPYYECVQRLTHRGYDTNLFSDDNEPPDEEGSDGAPGEADNCIVIAFSPKGKTLVLAGYDRTIQLWDVGSRKCF